MAENAPMTRQMRERIEYAQAVLEGQSPTRWAWHYKIDVDRLLSERTRLEARVEQLVEALKEAEVDLLAQGAAHALLFADPYHLWAVKAIEAAVKARKAIAKEEDSSD